MLAISRKIYLFIRPTLISPATCRSVCQTKNQFKKDLKSSTETKNDQENENKYDNCETNENNEKEKKTESKNKNDSKQEENQQENSQNDGPSSIIVRNDFEKLAVKNRETFLQMIDIFKHRDVHRRNHVEFIYAAMKHMKEYGVHRDYSVYMKLIDIMPKGKFVPTNMFQDMFFHYPKQQQCIIDLLDEMEFQAVMPDYELEKLLVSIFGKRGHPTIKFYRMMYWIPKFKHLNPWLLPNPVPEEAFELAKLGVRQMCSVDVESEISVLDTADVEDSLDKTWIVSGQSPEQRKLLREHPADSSLHIQGPFVIWLRNQTITYFTLVGDAVPDEMFEEDIDEDDVSDLKIPSFLNTFGSKENSSSSVKIIKKRSIHQQDDGTIYAICATGTSTKDSLLSWIRLLEKNGNPALAEIPVLFKFKSALNENSLVTTED